VVSNAGRGPTIQTMLIKFGSAVFYLGLAVATAGFLVDKAENIPWALRVVAPSYVRASEGLASLQIKGSLSPGEAGFTELETIVRREAEAKRVAGQLASQKIVKFTRKTGTLSFAEPRAAEVIPIEIALSSDKVDWELASLRARTDELKRTFLFRLSFVIFLLGITLTLGGRAIENRGKRPKVLEVPSPPSDSARDSPPSL
jgi:hypothetical protein